MNNTINTKNNLLTNFFYFVKILWGHRFENLTSSKTSNGYRAIDYSQFHETFPVNMSMYNDTDTDDNNTQKDEKKKKGESKA